MINAASFSASISIQRRRVRGHNRAATIALGEKNSRQSHRSARTGIYRERPNLAEWPTRDQQNTAHRALAGDSQIRQKIELQPVQFGAGNQPDVGLAGPAAPPRRWRADRNENRKDRAAGREEIPRPEAMYSDS